MLCCAFCGLPILLTNCIKVVVAVMGIGNLRDKIDSADKDKLHSSRNPPAYTAGFEPKDDEDDFDIDWGDSFGGSTLGSGLPGVSNDAWGASSDPIAPGFAGLGGPTGGSTTLSFGSSGVGGTSPGGVSGVGNFGAPPNTPAGAAASGDSIPGVETPKRTAWDATCDAAGEGLGAIGRILVGVVKSFGTRNYDDWGDFCRNWIFGCGITAAVGLVLLVIGWITDVRAFLPSEMPAYLLFAGTLGTLMAAFIMVACACAITLAADKYECELENIDILQPDGASTSDVEAALESQFSDFSGLFGDDDEDDDEWADDSEEADWDLSGGEDASDSASDNIEETGDLFTSVKAPETVVSAPQVVESPAANVGGYAGLGEAADKIARVPIITREILMGVFKPLLPLNTADFSDKVDVDPNSDEFADLEILCLKALASAMGKPDFTEVPSGLHRAVSAKYTYELRIKRVPGLSKLDVISKELEAYFKSSVDDRSVTCKTDIEGDFYVATITKGVKAVVTLGDLLQREDAKNFFLNNEKLLPICAGIQHDGEPFMVDAMNFDSMLIAGKPRSGKSWYIMSFIMQLCMFNTPERVQFLIVDPKKSNLLSTFSVMPHVCGVVDHSNILQVLDGVIYGEAERRRKLLSDNRCDKLSDLWELGVNVPILYILIDEYLTVDRSLSDGADKEFRDKIQIILTQLPSLGIRLAIVPHRAMGVVDRTTRTNIGFSAAIRAETSVITETLDIKKWDIPLLNPGDTALKVQGEGDAKYVSGLALTMSDRDNTRLVEDVARVFYQMGVDIPDMSAIGPGYTRNDDEILKQLRSESGVKYVQQDIDALPDD